MDTVREHASLQREFTVGISFSTVCCRCRHRQKLILTEFQSQDLVSKLAVRIDCPSCGERLTLRLKSGSQLESTIESGWSADDVFAAENIPSSPPIQSNPPTASVQPKLRQDAEGQRPSPINVPDSGASESSDWVPISDSFFKEFGIPLQSKTNEGSPVQPMPEAIVPPFAPAGPQRSAHTGPQNLIGRLLDRFGKLSQTTQIVIILLVFLLAIVVIMLPDQSASRNSETPTQPSEAETRAASQPIKSDSP